LVKFLDRCEFADAVETLAGEPTPTNGAHAPPKKIAAVYSYTDEAGELLFQVVRYDPKDFRQRRPDGTGWIWSTKDLRQVPYRLLELMEAIAAGNRVIVCEGEKDCDNLAPLNVRATCNAGGAGKFRAELCSHFAGADVIIIPDRDAPGREHAIDVADKLDTFATSVRILELPGAKDASDWIAAGGTADEFWRLVETAVRPEAYKGASTRGAIEEKPASAKLKPYDITDFLALEIPPREMILAPIIPEKATAMLYAARGNGKTHVAHGIAFAVATGTKFLKWTAPKPRRVLIVDGEMPASELQSRLSVILRSATIKPDPGMLNLLPADLVEGGIGNLADPKTQAALDPWLAGIELLILDNLSCLTTVIKDNDAESWGPIQEWLLRLRRRGISVLIVHHAGKNNAQRGTSRREDILDTSISLRRPGDYVAPEGARFEVHIEKGRGIHGDDANPFEARFETRDGTCQWTIREIEDAKLARVLVLHEDGLSLRDIADVTGIPKSTVERMLKKSAQA
jgi:hypothetical protein